MGAADQLALVTGKSTAICELRLIHVAPRGTTVGLTINLNRLEYKMDALIKVGLVILDNQKYDKLILVLGVKNEDFENSLIGTPYDNLNYLIIGILSFACLEILAAILSCCVGLKVHQLRHFSYHSGKN